MKRSHLLIHNLDAVIIFNVPYEDIHLWRNAASLARRRCLVQDKKVAYQHRDNQNNFNRPATRDLYFPRKDVSPKLRVV